MPAALNKFLLLMWKNWKIQFRHWKYTLFEVITPVICMALLLLTRGLAERQNIDAIKYPSFKTHHFMLSNPSNRNNLGQFDTKSIAAFLKSKGYSGIAYSPKFADGSVMQSILSSKPIKEVISIADYKNGRELQINLMNNTDLFAGIQFDDKLANEYFLPKKVHFSLRFPAILRAQPSDWKTNDVFPLLRKNGPREHANTYTASPGYGQELFLFLQEMVTHFIMLCHDSKRRSESNIYANITDMLGSDIQNINVAMSRFPYPAYVNDDVLYVLEGMFGNLIVLAFIITGGVILKRVTREKELQLKESMKIMGLPTWLHWTAWFVQTFILMLIMIVVVTFMMKTNFWFANQNIPSVLPKTNWLILFFLLLIYISSIITICFAISTFFNSANMAALCGTVILYLLYVPFDVLKRRYQDLSLTTILLSSLSCNSAIGYGFKLIFLFEINTEEGIQWNNFFQPVNKDDKLTMAHIFMMLIIDIVLYMLIALYVDAVRPGKSGVPKKWHFIFTMWVEKWNGDRNLEEHELDPDDPRIQSAYEIDAQSVPVGIEIRRLKKVFKGKVAVKDLSLKIYKDQITVLLGHNGAGKTTTISMLTGMITPSSGTAIVDGHNVETDMAGVRKSLGICPQHNILFDELTVAEHIYFYSRLKGMNREEAKKEINDFVKLLGLEDKRNMQSKSLSGGQKRKLSVAVAFCGNSHVVMLDEPSSGMDPSARRSLWELLQKLKSGRTIILTTHFMDEADVLGDRIAIMAQGELQCCGSSFFLKKRYGAGYHLIIAKTENCDVNKITQLLKHYIPEVQIERNSGSELSYSLNEKDSAVFQDMLKDIENMASKLGIRSYGISLTTLEEVFMKVGEGFKGYNRTQSDRSTPDMRRRKSVVVQPSAPAGQEDDAPDQRSSETRLNLSNDPYLTGSKRVMNQVKATWLKHVLSAKRKYFIHMLQVFLPIIMMSTAILTGRQIRLIDELPSRLITLNDYKEPITLLSTDESETIINIAQDILKEQGSNYTRVSDIPATIMDITKEEPAHVSNSYIIGASFIRSTNGIDATAWFNNDPYHSPPLALNFIYNAWMKMQFGSEYGIDISNAPLPFTLEDKHERQLLKSVAMGLFLSTFLCMCMGIITASFILFYVRERMCKAKHLQQLSGISSFILWATASLWDWTKFIIIIIIIMLTILAFQEDGFRTADDMWRLFIILFSFGFCVIPLIYVMSFWFEVPTTAVTIIISLSILLGPFGLIIVYILESPTLGLMELSKHLHRIFMIVPYYSLTSGIFDISGIYNNHMFCVKTVDICKDLNPMLDENTCWDQMCIIESQCCTRNAEYFNWERPGISLNLTVSFVEGFVFFLILILIEYRIFDKLRSQLQRKQKKTPLVPNESVDSDVTQENERVNKFTEDEIQQQSLVLQNVIKNYKSVQAVKSISLGVKGYECFGLLGLNGAGKTTTFKMMVGDESITKGSIYIKGLNLKTNMTEVQQLIGYCPQFEALLQELTGRETIKIICLIRGFASKDCNPIAQQLATEFDFLCHLDKRICEMSGGNKRKLSTAIALIGNPPILFLDEPSTGMDPMTKRHLWNGLCKIRDAGKCIVLTSHSMEECEALCTRLAIMVNGKFKCLGSIQHLKNKFSQGYTLTIKMRTTEQLLDDAPMQDYILAKFPNAVLREKYLQLITYYLPESDMPWSKMFGIMEAAKKQLPIEDYSLSQSSLEQVFLNLTKFQESTAA